jgi:hypothetical protein
MMNGNLILFGLSYFTGNYMDHKGLPVNGRPVIAAAQQPMIDKN